MRPPTAAKITISIDGTMPTNDGDIKPTCKANMAPPIAENAAATQNTKILKLATSYPEKRTRSSLSRMAISRRPSLDARMKRPIKMQPNSKPALMKYRISFALSVRRSQPSKVLRSVMPLTPPVNPCWPTISTVRISAIAWVTMEKYTSPTRRLNSAMPMINFFCNDTATTETTVKPKLWNGCHSQGNSVIWFQSMKSGMPGVDWILVLCGSDASSLRNIAMQ